MKVFRIDTCPNDYQSFQLNDLEAWNSGMLKLDCSPRAHKWEPPSVYVFNPCLEAGNFYSLCPGSFVIDSRAFETLRLILGEAGELLPLEFQGTVYYVVNILQCWDCLDQVNTKWVTGARTKLKIRIKEFAFNPLCFSTASVFKIPERRLTDIFTITGLGSPEEEFKSVVEKGGFKGIRFDEVWSDENSNLPKSQGGIDFKRDGGPGDSQVSKSGARGEDPASISLPLLSELEGGDNEKEVDDYKWKHLIGIRANVRKIFRVKPDVNTFQSFQPVETGVWGTDALELGCSRKIQRWSSPLVRVSNDKLEVGNFFGLCPGGFVVDASTRNALAGFFEMAGEILPLPFGDSMFYLINVLQCVNSLDQERTIWAQVGVDGPKHIIEYQFYPDRVVESSIFKIPETACSEVLTISGLMDSEDEFKFVVESRGFKGLLFEELWSG